MPTLCSLQIEPLFSANVPNFTGKQPCLELGLVSLHVKGRESCFVPAALSPCGETPGLACQAEVSFILRVSKAR